MDESEDSSQLCRSSSSLYSSKRPKGQGVVLWRGCVIYPCRLGAVALMLSSVYCNNKEESREAMIR
jgi:hypothetical protein